MFLGLDLGTSELKALLLSDAGQVHATASAALARQQPQPLWSEQHPADWWAAACSACAQLAAREPQAMARVQAVGLSGQMHGAVLMDVRGEVLRPAILWNDGRSHAQCAALEAAQPRSRHITGNLAMPGFTAPKLLWVQAHEPAHFAATRTVLLPKDWLRWRMSGECVSEMSDASGTLWLDVGARAWSPAMLAACGLTLAQMPRLVEGSAISGHLRADAAAELKLPAGIPIAGGAGDNAASAVGMGVVSAGQGFVSVGTSGVVFLAGERFAPNPAQAVHAFCHALPGRWHQMSVMLAAGASLQWGAQALGLQGDVGRLLALAQGLDEAARAQAPFFLPYLSGERTPHNDALATGAWLNLTSAHGAGDLAYAVAEGMCFGLADGWQALAAPADAALCLVGGGARSSHLAQLLADAMNHPLRVHAGGAAGAALGAARLAALCLGAPLADVCRVAPVVAEHGPRADVAALLSARRARWQAAYQALRAAR